MSLHLCSVNPPWFWSADLVIDANSVVVCIGSAGPLMMAGVGGILLVLVVVSLRRCMPMYSLTAEVPCQCIVIVIQSK